VHLPLERGLVVNGRNGSMSEIAILQQLLHYGLTQKPFWHTRPDPQSNCSLQVFGTRAYRICGSRCIFGTRTHCTKNIDGATIATAAATRVDEHFGFPVWPGFSHEHGLRLRRGLSNVKEYVGDDLWIGALGRCQGELTDTLDDRAVVAEAAHDGVRVG